MPVSTIHPRMVVPIEELKKSVSGEYHSFKSTHSYELRSHGPGASCLDQMPLVNKHIHESDPHPNSRLADTSMTRVSTIFDVQYPHRTSRRIALLAVCISDTSLSGLSQRHSQPASAATSFPRSRNSHRSIKFSRHRATANGARRHQAA